MRSAFRIGVAVIAVALVAGCATAPKGPSDEELVAQTVGEWQAAVLEKDIDRVMAITSEDFSNAEAADKEAWRSYLDFISASGYLDGAEVDPSGAETVINEEEGTATVGPIVLSTAAGVFNLELELAKEQSGWMVVGSTAR
jgi:hypothetical protein